MNISKTSVSATLTGAAVALIGVTGLIHLVLAPEDYGELQIRGALFVINGLLALVAAVGIAAGLGLWRTATLAAILALLVLILGRAWPGKSQRPPG